MHLKFGHITEIDYSNGLARVTFEEDDNIVSPWMPMGMFGTVQPKVIIPFSVNEHVYCMMDEYCESGVIVGAIYDAGNQPDGGAQNKYRVKFMQGLCVEYDAQTKTLKIDGTGKVKIDISGDAEIKCQKAVIDSLTTAEVKAVTEIKLTAPLITCGGVVTAGAISTAPVPGVGGADGNMSISGDITSTGKVEAVEIKEGSIRLGTHKHIGVQTGGGTSGTPVP